MPETQPSSTPVAAAAAGGGLLGSTDGAAAAEGLYEHGLEVKARSQWAYARKRFLRHRLAVASLIVVTAIFLTGALAGVIAPHSYSQIDLNYFFHAPTVKNAHYFGTDQLGRDYFSRVIYGIRTSEKVGLVVALLSSVIGLLVGGIAGYFGGWIDNILMRITDLVLTLPALPVLLTAAALLGQGNEWRVTLILAFFFWTPLARIIRGSFLSLREKEYVEAAKAVGAGDFRIMFRHMLPNSLGPIVVNGTLTVGTAILVEAALSFLGFGIQPPTPAWGSMLSESRDFLYFAWWLAAFPGAALALTALGVNLLGDWLRDTLDPKLRV